MRELDRRGVSPAELEAQDVAELPEREVMSLLDPSMTQGLLAYADQVNASKAAGTTPPSPPSALGLVNPATIRGDAASTPNGATTQNVNSPGSLASATRNQNLPVINGITTPQQ